MAKRVDRDSVSTFGGEVVEDLLNNLPIALYRTTPDGQLTAGNPALADLLGFTDTESMFAEFGTVSDYYATPETRVAWMSTVAEDGTVRDFDFRLRTRKGEEIWVRDTARAVLDEKGEIVAYEGALLDVSESIDARKARDLFIATVSHELRNPIAVVLGMSQIMDQERGRLSEEELAEMIRVVASQAEDASWIIEDLLVAHRGGEGSISVIPEDFDLTESVQLVLDGEAREIEMLVEEGLTVHADPRRTRQILRNLLSNAVRYGGSEILITAETEHDAVAITVCDTGRELTDDEQDRIFEPFSTTPEPSNPRSVGLGLSVARDLAAMMSGSLTYDHDGTYSRFTVKLPRGHATE